jgi:hypothetical protein
MDLEHATSGRVRPHIGLGTPAQAPSRRRDDGPAAERRPSEPRVSRFHLRLPGRGLPVAALQLEVGLGDLLRRARVTEPRLRGAGTSGIEPRCRRGDTRRSSMATRGRRARAAMAPPRENEVDDGDSGPQLEGGRGPAAAAVDLLESGRRRGTGAHGRPGAAPATTRVAPRRCLLRRGNGGLGRACRERRSLPGQPRSRRPAFATGNFRFERELGPSLDCNSATRCRRAGHANALADLRLATGDGRQVPYLLERRAEPQELQLTFAPAADADGGRLRTTGAVVSRYAMPLPFAGLPAGRLALATSARVFARELVLRAAEPDRAHGGEHWTTVAQLAWRHADPESTAPELTIELPAQSGDRLLLEVE